MMRDEAFHAILEAKYARIISAISELHGVSLEEAMDIFYNSPLLPLIEDGTADLHCRSDHYWPRRFGGRGECKSDAFLIMPLS